MAKWEDAPIIRPATPPSVQVAPATTDGSASGDTAPGFTEGNIWKYATTPIKALEPEAPGPLRDSLVGRIVGAAAKGASEAGPFYQPEMHAAVDQGLVGRYVTNPLLDAAKGVVGAVAGGTGQAAYEVGNAIGGPRLGRDVNMINQLLPAAGAMPGIVRPGGGPVTPGTIARNTAEPWEAARTPAPVTAEAFPPGVPDYGMPREQRIGQFLSEQPPEVVAAMAKTNPDVAAWVQRQAAGEQAGVAERQGGGGTGEPPPGGRPQPVTATPAATGPVTTSAQAKQVAGAYYKIADESGGTLAPGFVNKFIDGVEKILPQTEAGKVVAGESPTSALVQRLQTVRDKPMTLQAVQEVDEAYGSLIDKEYGVKGLSKEGQKLVEMQQAFREHIDNAGPGDITGGTAGFDALSPARKAWSQARKLDDLERIQLRASMTDNPATSIKTQIRTLLTNRTKSRGYDAAETAALEEAAKRGTLGSVLHVFGSRLVPLAAGAAGAGGGLASSILSAGVAHLGTAKLRDWGTALQENRLNNVMGVLGQSVPPNPNTLLTPPPS